MATTLHARHSHFLRFTTTLAVGVVLAVTMVLLLAAAAPALQRYDYARQWGSLGPGASEFNFLQYIDVDAAGNVYVVDCHNQVAKVYQSDGTYLRTFGVPVYGTFSELDQPEGIAVGSSSAYVVDYTFGSINKYDLLGVFATWYGGRDPANDPVGGSANGSFNLPGDAAVDGSGNIYVADTNNQRLQKLDSTGAFVCEIGHGGTNGLMGPLAVAVDSAGHVFATDFLREEVVRFSPSAGGDSYTVSGAWDASKSPNGDLGEPAGVACDAKGNVYVAGSYDEVITKLSPAGDVLAQWGGAGSGQGQFNYVLGVAVAADGTVYVSERDGDRIQAFTPVDTGPVTFAKAKVTVKKGKKATFKFKAYDDVSSKATYTLKIKKGSRVKKTVAVGLKGCTGAWLTKKWTCTLAKGSYKWYVYAKDRTGHAQTTPIGVKSLRVK